MKELLTKVNYTEANRTKADIKYLVIHYVGATGNAESNCLYFAKEYRGASAHYFVDFSGEVWRCVKDKDIAWHCGAKNYIHPTCRNQNSIGIELCVRKSSNWYFEDATIDAAVELVKDLMDKYSIPNENVIRHYDVTGKNCPEPFVRVPEDWNNFKNRLQGMSFAKGWHQDQNSKKWWYQYSASRYGYYKNCLQNIDGTIYAFDKEGWMIQGDFKCTTDENGAVYLV